MEHTINDVLRTTTLNYLQQLNKNAPPAPSVIEAQLLEQMQTAFRIENKLRDKGEKWPIPQKLDPTQIALIIADLYPVCTICAGGDGSDKAYDLLAIYQESGPNEGIYVTDETTFRNVILQYDFTIRNRDVNEVISVLRTIVPRKNRCLHSNLIAVNNGIFDYDTKTLMPFDPQYVFLAKSRVDYNANPTNPIIHNSEDGTDWDVESWMNDLSDDPEIVNLLWEILGAIIRPLVSWNKSAWLYSETGNNGKGTLCELMRQLCGEGTYASIPLSSMSKEFMLEPLAHASAIITDENDVGTFIDKAANLKAIITNDVIQMNRKNKPAISFRFYGFMVQCLNEMPRVKDKSDSFFRRQLFIPFTKCFTGRERKYIKYDYLHRKEVLEYVLHKVLNMNYYTLSEPEACKLVLEEYKEYNDPVRQFTEEILPIAHWDLLPFTMLYEMYSIWFTHNIPSGKIQSRNTFINDLLVAIENNPEWECKDKKKQIVGANRMDVYEPLLAVYKIPEWMNPKYATLANAEIEQKCTPIPGQYDKMRFRGIIRTDYGIKLQQNRTAQDDDNDTQDDDIT